MGTDKGLVRSGNAKAKSLLLLLAVLALPVLQGCVGLTSAGSSKTGGDDTTAPVTIDPPSVTNITATSATITWVTSIAATSQVDYGTTSSYGSQTTLSTAMVTSHSQALSGLKPSQLYHYEALSTDANNHLATSGDLTFTTSADTTPPTVSITSPASGATVSGTVTITASASDNVAVANVQFRVDGNNVGSPVTVAPYSYSLNTSTLSNGSHTLTAVATDTSNNTATSVGVTITVSNAAPPTVSITAPASGATVSGTVSVTANASSSIGVASVQFQLDGANVGSAVTTAPYSYSWSTTTAANGSHTLLAIAKDTAGTSTTSAGVTVTVSNPPPTVSITAPASGATVSGTVSVTANASSSIGVASVQFQLDGANVGSADTTSPYSYSWNTTTAVNGSHTVRAIAKDTAGNSTTSAGVTITVSNVVQPPTVSMTAPASGATVSGTVSVTANASSSIGIASVQFQLDGANVGSADTTSPYSYSWNSTTAVNGSHTLLAIAKDTAGTSTTSAGVTITVSNAAPPTVSMTAPASGATVSGTVSVTANASSSIGVASVQFQLDGANVGSADTTSPYSYSWNTTAAVNGSHTVRAVAKDTAGNSTTSAGVTVTVSNPPPTVSITAPASGATVSGTVSVTANASSSIGIANVQFRLDSTNVGSPDTTAPYSYSWNSTTAANGSHTLSAIATDTAGNSTTSAAVTVTTSNATPPGQSALATLAQSMAVGTFATLSTGNFNYGGISGGILVTQTPSDYITEFADAAGWDPVHHQLEYLGVPHGGPQAPWRMVIWDDASNEWSIGPLPNACMTTTPICIGHGYDHNTVDPTTGDLYHRQYNTTTVYKYTHATGTWSTIASIPEPDTNCCGALVWFPERGGPVFIDADWGVYLYAPGSNSWTQIANTSQNLNSALPQLTGVGEPGEPGYENPATYNPVNHTLMIVSGTTVWRMNADGTFTSRGTAPFYMAINSTLGGVDPVSGLFLILDGSNTLWTYDIMADTWTNTGKTAPFNASDGTIETPVPEYGVMLYVNYLDGASNVYVYKNAASGSTPPAVSVTAPSSGVTVSGTVSVTANASDSAGVASVQFQLDGANVGNSLTAAPYAYAWNTMAASNGSHTLDAIATATGGSSATSSSVTVTVSNSAGSTPPTIGAVTATSITASGATITWTTSTAASSQVNYGTTSSYGMSSSLNASLVTSHSVALSELVASTVYHYQVVSTDSSGNQATSGDFTFSTTTAGGGSTNGWATRISGVNVPGGSASIVSSYDFDSTITLPTCSNAPCTTYTPGAQFYFTYYENQPNSLGTDCTIAADGCSMKITILDGYFQGEPGTFDYNFSANLSRTFGPGQEFYVQYRERIDAGVLGDIPGAEGLKHDITTEGDTATVQAGDCSNSPAEIVTIQDGNQSAFPVLYANCGYSGGQYAFMQSGYQLVQIGGVVGSNYLDQVTAGCPHYGGRGTPTTDPSCWNYVPDEWFTIQKHIKIGAWGSPNSVLELWVAHDGQPAELVTNAADAAIPNDGSGGASGQYGKIQLSAYDTAANWNVDTEVWFDDLIVSTRRIPDANVATPNAPDSLSLSSVTASSVTVNWRVNSQNGTSQDDTGFLVERCAGAGAQCFPNPQSGFSQIGTTAPGASSYVDATAVAGTTYTYRVRATNPNGTSGYAAAQCFNGGTTCGGTVVVP